VLQIGYSAAAAILAIPGAFYLTLFRSRDRRHREEESADHLMTTGRAFGFAVLGRFGDHAVKHRDCLADLAGEEVAESVCDATVLDAHEAATPGGAVAV
jgi:hypothetical protein